MRVYGDQVRALDPRTAARALEAGLGAIDAMPPGLARHAALVGAFVEAGELVQGLTDDACAALDARTAVGNAGMRVLVVIAKAIDASWASGQVHDQAHGRVDKVMHAVGCGASTRAARTALAVLAAHSLPEVIEARHAEGYAFYALYPEAYLAAARIAPPGPRHVIGIRSIGVGLAALLAAALGARLPATVRPRGDPFRRRLDVAPALVAEWTSGGAARVAVADEGPGLSGSSFGVVIDRLEDAGVPLDRIECFPSHAGELGPAASTRHRERWARVSRYVVDVDALLLGNGTLARWIAGLVGPLRRPLEDISAGRWRAKHFGSEADWPACVVHQERRKLLAHTRDAVWLARFVGLGRDGDRALARARTLHAAGFTPEVAGLCHGFLVERWISAAPLVVARLDRAGRRRMVERVGRYLGFRAREFPAAKDSGASLDDLAEMVRHNAALALGAAPALRGSPAALAARVRRVEIDGRLHAWEWLVRGDGVLVKADALDHHAAHDLVGCQDIAWDLAGAAVELGLSTVEQASLVAVTEETSDRAVDPDLLAFARPCYLAFQLGRHALAKAAGDDEAARLEAAVARYAAALAVL
jgi:hypothetical protein